MGRMANYSQREDVSEFQMSGNLWSPPLVPLLEGGRKLDSREKAPKSHVMALGFQSEV